MLFYAPTLLRLGKSGGKKVGKSGERGNEEGGREIEMAAFFL